MMKLSEWLLLGSAVGVMLGMVCKPVFSISKAHAQPKLATPPDEKIPCAALQTWSVEPAFGVWVRPTEDMTAMNMPTGVIVRLPGHVQMVFVPGSWCRGW